MKKPRFSIITCTFNSEKYLPDTIKSLEFQDFKDYEHIFIDGFSKDNTTKIIEEYKKGKTNIKFVQLKPKGISNAMNEGIKKAKGDIIHILHSDDFYLNSKVLSTVDKLFKRHKCRWLVGKPKEYIKGKLITTRPHWIRKYFYLFSLPLGANIAHENTFVLKKIFEKHGYFREDFKNAMDYEFWLRILKHEKPEFTYYSFAAFRYHEASVSTSGENEKREMDESKRAFILHYGKSPMRIIHTKFMQYTQLKRKILRKLFRVQR
ncbi:MAG: glycosyltransferase [Candidatus Cloacimonetes bacterium]|nr:glycosyltransferase [Candidatus Cloacimonadota bacterium]